MATRESQASSAFILFLGGLLLVLVVLALFVFVLPIAPDPRPRKPMDGVTDRTTYWDKWTWERHVRRARQE